MINRVHGAESIFEGCRKDKERSIEWVRTISM